jgi:hypothetical protein
MERQNTEKGHNKTINIYTTASCVDPPGPHGLIDENQVDQVNILNRYRRALNT